VNDFKFGWEAVTERYPPGELLQYAIAAYEAGFDSIVWSERRQAGFAWTWLGAAAVKTERSCWARE